MITPARANLAFLSALAAVVLIGSLPAFASPDSLAPPAAPAADTALSAATPVSAAGEEEEDLDAPPGFPVRLGDREVFRVFAADRFRAAEERARNGSERLLRFARGKFPVDSIAIEPTAYGADVRFGGKLAFAVYEADAKAEGRSAEEIAKGRAAAIRAAVIEYREARTLRRLLIGALIAVLVTVGLWFALRGLGSLHGKLRRGIEAWVAEREEKIKKRTMTVLQASHVLRGLNSLAGLLRAVLTLLLVYLYLYVVFSLFPWTKSVAERLEGMVTGPIGVMGKSFLDTLPGLIFVFIVVVLTRYALRLLQFLFVEIEGGRIQIQGFYREWAKPTYNLLRVLGIFFALVVAFPYIPGSESEAFKGVSLFLGLLLSLGSSSAVSNVVAGFVLTYMRAFRVGDVVHLADARGVVTQVTLLATHIRTPKNEIITIPNATVLAARVTNYTALAKEPGLILHTKVTVGYDAPWRQVHALLLGAADKTEGIQKNPAPFVLQRELEQVQIAYELNAYTDSPERMLRIYSDLHQNIQDAFNEHGVQIMTPFYEADKPDPVVVPKEKWFAPPAKKPD